MVRQRTVGDPDALLGGIEAGGTKFICLIGRAPDDIVAEVRLPTRTPDETIADAIAFFRAEQEVHGPLAALGIASFGPLDLAVTSPTYGHITSTTKPGWAETDMVGVIGSALNVPVAFDTDVNGAALAERRWGAARDVQDFVYVTVGTGIGGGVMVADALVHGALHPEIGHMFVPHDRVKDPFPGSCPFHRDCLEGLASAPAVEARLGGAARDAAVEHPAWGLVAEYLALMCINLTMTLSPARIILGGGLMQRDHLFPMIRSHFTQRLNNYIRIPEVGEDLEQYIVPAGLGRRSGAYGALALASQAFGGGLST